MAPQLRIHSILHGSRVNGPGRRTVIHVQGCRRHCPGCFNPAALDPAGGERFESEALAAQVLAAAPEGLTVSGGEPFEQPEGLLALFAALRRRADLSILVFSGYTLAEIRQLPDGALLLPYIDVLVDGPYRADLPAVDGLRGSANQVVHCLSARHRPEELTRREIEVVVEPDGSIRISGFPDPDWLDTLRAALDASVPP